MFSDVVTEMQRLVPGLIVALTGGPGGAGYTYTYEGQEIGTVRSMNGRIWRIDGDPPGYPFSSEQEATMELFRRSPGPYKQSE